MAKEANSTKNAHNLTNINKILTDFCTISVKQDAHLL